MFEAIGLIFTADISIELFLCQNWDICKSNLLFVPCFFERHLDRKNLIATSPFVANQNKYQSNHSAYTRCHYVVNVKRATISYTGNEQGRHFLISKFSWEIKVYACVILRRSGKMHDFIR